jgi:peptide/nickel transport system permease protein
MLRYVIRRVLYAIPILAGVCLFTFFLFFMSSSPEQMARRNISAKHPTETQVQNWIHQHGYDEPHSVQFRKYLVAMFTFHFGNSDTTGEPISLRIRRGVWPSLQVASMVFFAGVITDIFFAIYFAYFRGTYIDNAGRTISVLTMSISYVVFLIIGQYFLGAVLKLAPVAGYDSGWASWKFTVIPTIIGVVSGFGSSVRLYRTFILEEINQDYVRTAQAKGVSEPRVLFRHVLKNAAIPIITSVVISIPFLVTGSLLLESFFGIPGIGYLTKDAIFAQDFSTIRATTFLYTILYIIGAIMTDICYAMVDPRVRLE